MRALRRHHRARLKNKMIRRDQWSKQLFLDLDDPDDMRWYLNCMNMAVTTPKPRSLPYCGNPRRYKFTGPERTVQERRHYQESISQRIFNG